MLFSLKSRDGLTHCDLRDLEDIGQSSKNPNCESIHERPTWWCPKAERWKDRRVGTRGQWDNSQEETKP